MSDSEDNIEVADLSQSSSDHFEVSPQRIANFLNETFRQRKVIIQKHFPDLPAFLQTERFIIKNHEDFEMIKPQIHRLRKLITKVRTECSQQQPNFLDIG